MTTKIYYLRYLEDYALPLSIGVAILLLLLGAAYLDKQEEKQWANFSKTHDCKIVGKKAGSLQIGVAPIMGGSGGVGIVVTPTSDQTGWLCNDGITYWR